MKNLQLGELLDLLAFNVYNYSDALAQKYNVPPSLMCLIIDNVNARYKQKRIDELVIDNGERFLPKEQNLNLIPNEEETEETLEEGSEENE